MMNYGQMSTTDRQSTWFVERKEKKMQESCYSHEYLVVYGVSLVLGKCPWILCVGMLRLFVQHDGNVSVFSHEQISRLIIYELANITKDALWCLWSRIAQPLTPLNITFHVLLLDFLLHFILQQI